MAPSNPTGLFINTDVLYEETFSISHANKYPEVMAMMNDTSPRNIRLISKNGRKSPITGQRVRLEVAVSASGNLVSSLQACRRYLERMNGLLEYTPSGE